MPRRKCHRRISFNPNITFFKPAGIPLKDLEELILESDEIEAIRLAYLEKMYQEDAANEMGISRQTFGRIISSAQQKIADGLINGKALRLQKQSIIHNP